MNCDDEKATEKVVEFLNIIAKSPSKIQYLFHNTCPKKEIEKRSVQIKDHLHKVIDFLNIDVKYEPKLQMWKSTHNFLNYIPCSVEEAVVLAELTNGASHYGANLESAVNGIINKVLKYNQMLQFQTNPIEKSLDIQRKITTLNALMMNRSTAYIGYLNYKNDSVIDIVTPVKVINIEYYWYLIYLPYGASEPQNMLYLALYKIQKILAGNPAIDPHTLTLCKSAVSDIDKGMNAFYKPYNVHTFVIVYVADHFVNYIVRAPFFFLFEPLDSNNKTISIEESYEKDGEIYTKKILYHQYRVPSTDEYYRDIIPTILRYMPHLIVPSIAGNENFLKYIHRTKDKMHNYQMKLDKALSI